ncbi:hypothetical protein IFM89_000663 [Coptis chinensis]|uniref:SCP2 domain-containing protein n=1 Tax=Coptis chinensis TaxID=261450 RepID=A0A835IJ87_9MAGN|nr:hypothetical protein IFM89_000663 [Coptis chinensis]
MRFFFREQEKIGINEEIFTVDLKKGEVAQGLFEGKPNVTFSLKDEDFVKVVTGKMNPQFAFMRRSFVVRTSSALADSPIAPLRLESPIGQFLSHILKSHPHLVPVAVDQQFEQLQADRDAEKITPKEEPSPAGTDLILYRRIAEVKANERNKALEEILSALVVQKFVDADVSLIPSIAPSSHPSGKVDTWLNEEEKLEELHSQETFWPARRLSGQQENFYLG